MGCVLQLSFGKYFLVETKDKVGAKADDYSEKKHEHGIFNWNGKDYNCTHDDNGDSDDLASEVICKNSSEDESFGPMRVNEWIFQFNSTREEGWGWDQDGPMSIIKAFSYFTLKF